MKAFRRATARARLVTCGLYDIDIPVQTIVRSYDFVVLGSGIAGLTYATKVAQYGTVAIITKEVAAQGCTALAQGGICAVLDKIDSVDKHIRDTIVAGEFLNSEEAVRIVCSEGAAAVMDLVDMGAKFTRDKSGKLHLTREGGHSERRIVHADDMTGREVERALLAVARGNPNIHFYEHHLAVDLVQDEVGGLLHCLGVDVLDQRSQVMTRFIAPVTMLATGGAGQVYPNTTNPGVITGDGMAMAYRARASIGNMEFVQFHPTGFANPKPEKQLPGGRTFLISEAVRGEGGLLFNASGERFMPRYDDRAELAPRDVVARAIQDEMVAAGSGHVWLDISHKSKSDVLHHFPNIAQQCAEYGLDITAEPIPVAPAQHYMCGGVMTGLYGETTLPGLFAVGEVACSGLHGANRLASNSLLEGLVFGARAVQPSVQHLEYLLSRGGQQLHHAAAHAVFTGSKAPRQLSPGRKDWIAAKRQHLTQVMWEAAGIVRRKADLIEALRRVSWLNVEVQAMQEAFGVSTDIVELRNLATVGELILVSALSRRESRGGHFCLDYPEQVAGLALPTVLTAPRTQSWPRQEAPSRGAATKKSKSSMVVLPDRLRQRDVAVRSYDPGLN